MSRPPSLVLLAAALVAAPPSVSAQEAEVAPLPEVVEGRDFRVFGPRGRSRSFAELVAAMGRADAVVVGEQHDDAIGHGVEAQILVRAYEAHGRAGAGRPVVLSLEMFERDVQYIVDEYLAGLITEDQFLRSARPWDRYATDYRPMVEFARVHGLPVVAANAPRRYVNRVTRLGPGSLADLPAEARRFLPALPYPGPSARYEAQWNALMAEAGGGHGMGYALDAQALWDAAMGGAVAEALTERPGALVVHYAGAFHVASYTGIPERVAEARPGAEVVTVVMRPAADVHAWDDDEHRDLGDWVILTRAPEPPAG